MESIVSKELIIKFLKFGVVGFIGLIVDFSTTYVCKEWIKIHKYVSNAIGFTMAASVNYLLNRIWTFKSINPEIAYEYGQFLIVSVIGLLINTFILWFLVSKNKFNFYLAKLIAIGIVTIWNFFANLLYTFA